MREEALESKTIFQGKFLKLREDKVLLSNGRESTRLILEHPGAAAIVPLTEHQEIIMVEQFRKPTEEVLLEIPAGKLDQGESPEQCAARELMEETGYKAGKMEKLAAFYTTPGFCNEIIHVYLATSLELFEACPDENEVLKKKLVPLATAWEMIETGEIKDSKTIVGILMVKNRLSGR